MKGKELRKKVKEFSHRTNFYKLGLIKKYIKRQYYEEQKLINSIPDVVCPSCKGKRISLDYDDREYINNSWLFCNDCGETFDDIFDYIDIIGSIECLSWSDRIAIELHYENPDIKSHKWQVFCEKEIKKYLGLIQEEAI